jgi:G3E family GTPase
LSRLNIITGFLGAGKTTLINKLLAECWRGERPVLIENEFGDVPIDSELINDADIQVKTLASGCICCTLKTSFVDGIIEVVRRFAPERILIEPTGLADLEDVLSACREAAHSVPLTLDSIITVVSSENLLPLLAVGGEFFPRQIQEARFVLVSRSQLCSGEELSEVVSAVRNLNPVCPIMSGDWAQLDSLAITTAAEEALAMHEHDHKHECHHDHDYHDHEHHDHEHHDHEHHDHEHHDHEHHDHEHCCHHHHHHGDAEEFTALPFFPARRWSASGVETLLDALKDPALGEIFRAKGFLTLDSGERVLAEYVYGSGSFAPRACTGGDRFVVIGRNLDRAALRQLIEGA